MIPSMQKNIRLLRECLGFDVTIREFLHFIDYLYNKQIFENYCIAVHVSTLKISF